MTLVCYKAITTCLHCSVLCTCAADPRIYSSLLATMANGETRNLLVTVDESPASDKVFDWALSQFYRVSPSQPCLISCMHFTNQSSNS
jgi:hypothetical protein